MHFYVFTLLIFLFASTAQSAEPFMKHYGLSDGLPNVQVFDLYGANDQLLYLGTSNGLYRFNGIRFDRLPFEKEPASISYISEHAGQIWCKDFSNRLFYVDNEILKEYLPVKKFLSKGPLVNYQLEDSVLYLATRHEFISYSLKTKKHHKIAPSSSQN